MIDCIAIAIAVGVAVAVAVAGQTIGRRILTTSVLVDFGGVDKRHCGECSGRCVGRRVKRGRGEAEREEGRYRRSDSDQKNICRCKSVDSQSGAGAYISGDLYDLYDCYLFDLIMHCTYAICHNI